MAAGAAPTDSGFLGTVPAGDPVADIESKPAASFVGPWRSYERSGRLRHSDGTAHVLVPLWAMASASEHNARTVAQSCTRTAGPGSTTGPAPRGAVASDTLAAEPVG